MKNRLIVLVLAAAFATSFASSASAQTALTNAVPPVTSGQKVWVTTNEGWEVNGVVSKLGATFIEVSGEAGTKHINFSDARKIDIKDSNWSGFWLGAAIGGGLSALLMSDLECTRGCSKAKFVAFEALSWGGLGALIDHFVEGRERVWENRDTTALHVSPIVAPKGLGVGGSISWK